MFGLMLNKLYKRYNYYEKIDNIFDYYNIMKKRPDKEICFATNSLYGISYCLKRYSGYTGRIKCAIEHGMPHTFENESEFKNNSARVLLVCSNERKKKLKSYCNKEIIPIGPHIAYSKKIYDDDAMQDTKENLGKTLLIYPMHSIEDYHFANTTRDFIKYVEGIKNMNDFDTVLVSVYFVDIQRGLHIPYLQKGWQIVTAGNRLNYDFMDVQRTIMELSDAVICQGYSSALGYAGYLKKPIIFKDMKLKVRHDNQQYEVQEMWGGYKERLMELFSGYTENLDDEQYSFLKQIYGYDSVKTASELKNIFFSS